MDKITFTDATLKTQGYVTINGTNYDIVDTTYTGGTDLNASTFNTMQDNIANPIESGWNLLSNTFTYSSYNSTTLTGIVTTSSDLTSIISVGMKIKFTQGSTIKYGIITAIDSSTITIFMGTQYTLENTTISNFNYSIVKCPYGFPMNENYWKILVTNSTLIAKGSPITNTWYNTGVSINIPIGLWKLNLICILQGDSGASTNSLQPELTVSTSNTSISNSYLNREFQLRNSDSLSIPIIINDYTININNSTLYYILFRTDYYSSTSLYLRGDTLPTQLWVTCAYL